MYDKTTDVEIQKDWSLFLKTYFHLKEIAREYDKVHNEGIKSFAGSGKDVFGQLDWEMSLPNFWNFKFQADEARYSYIQLRRDQIIREKIDEMKTLYSNMMNPELEQPYHKMMIFDHDPNWLIIFEAKLDLEYGRKNVAHIINLFTYVEEEIFYTLSMTWGAQAGFFDNSLLIWHCYGDSHISGDWLYYCSFDDDNREHNLTVINLKTQNPFTIEHDTLDQFIRSVQLKNSIAPYVLIAPYSLYPAYGFWPCKCIRRRLSRNCMCIPLQCCSIYFLAERV